MQEYTRSKWAVACCLALEVYRKYPVTDTTEEAKVIGVSISGTHVTGSRD